MFFQKIFALSASGVLKDCCFARAMEFVRTCLFPTASPMSHESLLAIQKEHCEQVKKMACSAASENVTYLPPQASNGLGFREEDRGYLQGNQNLADTDKFDQMVTFVSSLKAEILLVGFSFVQRGHGVVIGQKEAVFQIASDGLITEKSSWDEAVKFAIGVGWLMAKREEWPIQKIRLKTYIKLGET